MKNQINSLYTFFFVCLMVTLNTGCSTSSSVVTGTARASISTEMVKVYRTEPELFEEIALVEANSKRSMKLSAQGKTDAAIVRIKEEAAKLGANGVLLLEISEGYGGSISFGVGTGSYGHSGGASVGAGSSTASTYKIVKGVAMYVFAEGKSSP